MCSSCGMYKKYVKSHNGVVSFEIFTKLILDETEKKCEQIHNCNSDFHWRPFISQCAYCHSPYTVIGRLETADEDQKYISHMANVTIPKIGNMARKFKVWPMTWFYLEYNKSSGGSTAQLSRKYFSEIDISTAKKLYELYKVDFEMFSYNPEEYYKYTRKL